MFIHSGGLALIPRPLLFLRCRLTDMRLAALPAAKPVAEIHADGPRVKIPVRILVQAAVAVDGVVAFALQNIVCVDGNGAFVIQHRTLDGKTQYGISAECRGDVLPPGIVNEITLGRQPLTDLEAVTGAEIDGSQSCIVEAEMIGFPCKGILVHRQGIVGRRNRSPGNARPGY
jgi:hypothetical protein